MPVARTWWWWGLVLLAAALYAMWSVYGRARLEWRDTRQLVVSLPYGDGVHDVGRWVGVDGRRYGPLSFAVGGGQVAIADTYHERVLWHPLERAGAPWTTRSVPESMLSSIAWDSTRRGWLVADDRAHQLWVVREAGATPGIRLAAVPGTTLAWQQLMVSPTAVYVAWTAVGAGQFRTALARYRANGRAQLVAAWGQTQLGEWHPAGRTLIRVAATSYMLGEGGRIYAESPTSQPGTVALWEFSATGQPLAEWRVRLPGGVLASRLVGAAQGQVYLGVNLGIAGEWARIYAAAPREPVQLRLTLPPPRELLHTYVRVGAHGTLYWAISTARDYQIWAGSRRQVSTGGLHL